MRIFEITVHKYYWIALITGFGILYYLYKNDESIWIRIRNEVRQLLGHKPGIGEKYHNEVASLAIKNTDDVVINAQLQSHVQVIIAQSRSELLTNFLNILSEWKPRRYHYEYQFRDTLYSYLRSKMPEATIETEKPIGRTSEGNRGRADIIINDTILLELKRDTSAGAIQRAKGQIMQYSHIWKDKGPVILLLCNYEYDHAKVSYTSTLNDLAKLERSALAIVVNQN